MNNKIVLDLGCGTGRDVYLLSQFVGENGGVIGIDMTDEQLDIANKYVDFHKKQNNYIKTNVIFQKGYIEKLDELDIESGTIDIIVSNCVVNLSPDKESVFSQAYKLLKEGGEFYFSDVYSSRRISDELKDLDILFGFKANLWAVEEPLPVHRFNTARHNEVGKNPNIALGKREEITGKVFCEFAKKIMEKGATILGGCCETDSSHIRELSKLK